MKWSRSTLLRSSIVGSIVNLLTPIFLAKFVGFEFVAIWMGGRAAVQLLAAGLPNPANTILQAIGREDLKLVADEYEKGLSAYFLFIGVLSLLMFSGAVCFVFPNRTGVLTSLALGMYMSLFLVASMMGVILRAKQRGDLIVKNSNWDAIFTAVSIFLLPYGVVIFLCVNSIKEALKIKRATEAYESKNFIILASPAFFFVGAAQYLKGISQVISQYAERLIFPWIFGLALAGQSGIGSSIGAVVIMLSSTAYVWAFRKIAENDSSVNEFFLKEWSLLILLSGSLCWGVYFVGSILSWHLSDLANIAISATFSSAMGVSFLATARSATAILSRKVVVAHIASIVIIYAAIYCAALYGFEFGPALIIGLTANSIYIASISFKIERRLRLAVSGSQAATLACAIIFYLLERRGFLTTSVAAVFFTIYAVPYLIWVIGRRMR